MQPPRIMIAAPHSGAGKSTVSLSLMAALAGQGIDVRPFKVGPDYIDPGLHAAACKRPSHNLDAWLTPEAVLLDIFRRHAPGRDGIAVIEGVMGLFDGQGGTAFAGTAHAAALVGAPVLLVVNVRGMSLSAAALVRGFASFKPEGAGCPNLSGLRVAGVILNQTASPRQAAQLAEIIKEHTGLPCLGHMPRGAAPPMPERHLGLVPAGEQHALAATLARLADAAREYLDLEGILRIARDAPPLSSDAVPETFSPPAAPYAGLRLGLAEDAAFSFYYRDGLDLLQKLGVELVPFSPLADRAPPRDIHGLYLGGGFPELFAEALEGNESMRNALPELLEKGMPAYAECGGMLYLCKSLLSVPSRPARRMTGFFPLDARMTKKLQPFGYVELTLEENCLLGPAGTRIKAHEFHYSALDEASPPVPGSDATGPADSPIDSPGDSAPPVFRQGLFKAEKNDGRAWRGGLARARTLAWYPHLHFRGCPEAARSFLGACAAYAGRPKRKEHTP